MSRRPWTAADVLRVRTLRVEYGLSIEAIAERVGRSKQDVRKKAGRPPTQSPRPRAQPELIAEIKATLAREIAAAKAEARLAPPFKPGAIEW